MKRLFFTRSIAVSNIKRAHFQSRLRCVLACD